VVARVRNHPMHGFERRVISYVLLGACMNREHDISVRLTGQVLTCTEQMS
jgi:hypothetical protein